MDVTPERADMGLSTLWTTLERLIAGGFSADTCRYAYAQYTGALFLAYSMGLLDEAEHNRRFSEAQRTFYDAFEGGDLANEKASQKGRAVRHHLGGPAV